MTDKPEYDSELIGLFNSLIAESGKKEKYLSEARSNKIGDEYLNYLGETRQHDNTELSELLERKERESAEFDPDVQAVASILDRHEIQYAIIKTKFPFEYRSWDINLLIDGSDRQRVIELFKYQGWYRTTLREHPIARTEPGKVMLEHEENHPIHLHFSVSWNGIEYVPSSLVLANTREIDGVQYPTEQIDWLIHCAHSVFENYELTIGEAYLLENFEPFSDQRTLSNLGLSEAVELATSTAELICNQNVDAKPPIEYPKEDLFSAWNAHADGVQKIPEFLSHGFQYGLKVVK